MAYNPATVPTLVNRCSAASTPATSARPLHCRVRYFDPEHHRAGLPEDVAALVDRLTDKETGITLVNISPVASRTVIVQGGAYGEHRFIDVTVNGEKTRINSSTFTVELAPCSGAHLVAQHQALRQRADDELPVEKRHSRREIDSFDTIERVRQASPIFRRLACARLLVEFRKG